MPASSNGAESMCGIAASAMKRGTVFAASVSRGGTIGGGTVGMPIAAFHDGAGCCCADVNQSGPAWAGA